jgi:hypothetical protein
MTSITYATRAEAIQRQIIPALGRYVDDYDVEQLADRLIGHGWFITAQSGDPADPPFHVDHGATEAQAIDAFRRDLETSTGAPVADPDESPEWSAKWFERDYSIGYGYGLLVTGPAFWKVISGS